MPTGPVSILWHSSNFYGQNKELFFNLYTIHFDKPSDVLASPCFHISVQRVALDGAEIWDMTRAVIYSKAFLVKARSG